MGDGCDRINGISGRSLAPEGIDTRDAKGSLSNDPNDEVYGGVDEKFNGF